MLVRLANYDESAPTLREYLHECAKGVGIRGEELVATVAEWGVLADELAQNGRVPSVAAYAERFQCSELEAEFRLTMFQHTVKQDPLVFHRLQWQAAERAGRWISFFDDVRVVAA